MFDVALVNGIFNLNPDRAGLFQELARVQGSLRRNGWRPLYVNSMRRRKLYVTLIQLELAASLGLLLVSRQVQNQVSGSAKPPFRNLP